MFASASVTISSPETWLQVKVSTAPSGSELAEPSSVTRSSGSTSMSVPACATGVPSCGGGVAGDPVGDPVGGVVGVVVVLLVTFIGPKLATLLSFASRSRLST